MSRSENKDQKMFKLREVDVVLRHWNVSISLEMILKVCCVTILAVNDKSVSKDGDLIVRRTRFLVNYGRIL